MSSPSNGPAGVLAPGGARPSDAPPDGGDGGGGGRWAHLLTAPGTVEAEIVRGCLEAAGIPVALDSRDPSPQAWLFLSGNMRAPVKVLVPATLLDAARLELLEAGIDAEAPQPSDGGTAANRPRPRWMLAAALAGLAAAALVIVEIAGSVTCALKLFC